MTRGVNCFTYIRAIDPLLVRCYDMHRLGAQNLSKVIKDIFFHSTASEPRSEVLDTVAFLLLNEAWRDLAYLSTLNLLEAVVYAEAM